MIMKKRKENGQALVEFALILPVLLVILCGILDFGWIYYNKYRVEDVAYKGARYASIKSENYTNVNDLMEATEDYVEQIFPGATARAATVGGPDQISVTVTFRVKNLTFVGWTAIGEYYIATSTSVASI